MKHAIIKKTLALMVLCMFLICTMAPAFAVVAFVQEGGWFWGNDTFKIGRNMVAGTYNPNLYLGGMALFIINLAVS